MFKKLTVVSLLLSCAILMQSAMAVDHVHLTPGSNLDCAVHMGFTTSAALVSAGFVFAKVPVGFMPTDPAAIVIARSVTLQRSRSPPNIQE